MSAWYQLGMHGLFRGKAASREVQGEEINSVYSIEFKKISCCYVTGNHRELNSAEYFLAGVVL